MYAADASVNVAQDEVTVPEAERQTWKRMNADEVNLQLFHYTRSRRGVRW